MNPGGIVDRLYRHWPGGVPGGDEADVEAGAEARLPERLSATGRLLEPRRQT